MKIEPGWNYAVITGDVIGSSKLKDDDRFQLLSVMQAASLEIRKQFPTALPFEVDIYRGDGWQLLINDPFLSLRIGLAFRSYIRAHTRSLSVDARMAISLGTINFLPEENVSRGDGEAFRNSGRALESMGKSQRLRFDFPGSTSPALVRGIDTQMQLIDVIAIGWTARQAQAIGGSLRGWNQTKIARTWQTKPISQQGVAQHLDRAHWNAIERSLIFFEETLPRILPVS
jgi:hypothetical protein